MNEDVLTARIEGGTTIAVTTAHPYFCASGATAGEARATLERARAFYRASPRPRPAVDGPVDKPDFVRPARMDR